MNLATFIQTHQSLIIEEWEDFAKTLSPAADSMSKLQLQDHIEELLSFFENDIKTVQSSEDKIKKSQGLLDSGVKDTAAHIHGILRYESGFNLAQMVSEYRALRSAIIKLWTHVKTKLSDRDVLDLIRFNEAIDQALAESVLVFMQKVDFSTELLLGILGHDLRSPLSAIKMSANLMPMTGPLTEKQVALATQIGNSSSHVSHIVNDLLDLTRARLGNGLPVFRDEMDMGILASQMVDDIKVQYPQRAILLEVSGNVDGQWDRNRIGQVFYNLMHNAVEYGAHDLPINVVVIGGEQHVLISVHNGGPPIPQAKLSTLFNSFASNESGESFTQNISANHGLGLFITKEIVSAHDGEIHVVSNEHEGTSFTITLPRLPMSEVKYSNSNEANKLKLEDVA